MAQPRALWWASAAAALGAAGFGIAFVWSVWPASAPAPVAVSAPPPAAEPASLPPSGAEAALTEATSAYLAAVARVPGDGMSSREVAVERRRVFEREVERLAALGAGAVPRLAARLASERDDHARLLLLTALSRIEGDAGVRGALAALETLADPTLESLFLDRLVRSDDAQSLRLLEAVLRESPRPETRASVLTSAAQRGDVRLAGRLPELALHDDNAAVRAQALATAERLGVPLAPALLEQLAHADPDPALRARALGALASSDPRAFVGFSRRALVYGTPDAEEARIVTQALARSPDAEAGALLEELAGAPDPAVRDAAAQALRARSARSPGR
jgi:HEAT repeats